MNGDRKIVPVITKAGEICGRSAIILERVNVINETTFELEGTFNGNSCSKLSNGIIPYNIVFNDVLIFKMVQLDLNEIPYKSSFDVVENSSLVAQLIETDKANYTGKIDESFRHFVFWTYDTVFEIIGKGFDLRLS